MTLTPTLWLLCYFLLAGLVVFLAIKLSDYVDLLDKKTKLSGALLGGILLAAVTSLPELFTSLTATVGLGNNQLVLGNIMGSDFFDIVIFGVVYFMFFKLFTQGKVGKQHYTTIFFVSLMIVAVTLAAFVFDKYWTWGYFNPMSIVIVIIYIISIIKTPKVEEKEKEEDTSKLTVKQIWTLFIICSVILIGASILVTLVTDKVVSEEYGFGFGATFGGSLFLGVATSLPEVTATIALCKKKNFDAAYGDIFGSCVFNIIILAIADALSFKAEGKLFTPDTSSLLLIIGTAFVLLISFLSILFIRSKYFKNDCKSRIILYLFTGILILSYVAYLVLYSTGVSII